MSTVVTPMDAVIARLQRVLEERERAILGTSDSMVLLALAQLVSAYIRHQLQRELDGKA